MQQTIACGKERKKERVLKPCEFSAVPSGLLDGAFQTQDYVLGYFQPSLRDLVQSFHADALGRTRIRKRGPILWSNRFVP